MCEVIRFCATRSSRPHRHREHRHFQGPFSLPRFRSPRSLKQVVGTVHILCFKKKKTKKKKKLQQLNRWMRFVQLPILTGYYPSKVHSLFIKISWKYITFPRAALFFFQQKILRSSVTLLWCAFVNEQKIESAFPFSPLDFGSFGFCFFILDIRFISCDWVVENLLSQQSTSKAIFIFKSFVLGVVFESIVFFYFHQF